MEISENKVYVFRFSTDHGDISIPVKATSREEAGDNLQKMFSRFQTELAMEFPKVAPEMKALHREMFGENPKMGIPAEVLELRIDTLLKDMGAGALTGKAKAETITNWTGIGFAEANYPAIITALELLLSGKSDLPPKSNDKKNKS